MAMLQSNAKKADLKYFVNQKVTGIRIEEFGFSLLFGFNKELTVNTHWELYDTASKKIIDRGMALKIREQMLLFKLIGVKVTSYLKDPFLVELVFDNNMKLVVH